MSLLFSKIKRFFRFRHPSTDINSSGTQKRKAADDEIIGGPLKKQKQQLQIDESRQMSNEEIVNSEVFPSSINDDNVNSRGTSSGVILNKNDKVKRKGGRNKNLTSETLLVDNPTEQMSIVKTKKQQSILGGTIALHVDDDNKEESFYLQFCRFMLPYGFNNRELPQSEEEAISSGTMFSPSSLTISSPSPLTNVAPKKTVASKATITMKPKIRVASTMTCANLTNYRTIGVSDDVIDAGEEEFDSANRIENDEKLNEFTTDEVDILLWINDINELKNQVIVSKFNLNVTIRDIETLRNDVWLNDVIINFYLNLISDRTFDHHNNIELPKVFTMNTFFYPRLTKMGYPGVARWTRKNDIFAYDILLIPVHMDNNHWSISIVFIKERIIKYYDSLNFAHKSILNIFINYLEAEHFDKKKTVLNKPNFKIEIVKNCPRQRNSVDCGVFSCMFANYVCKNKIITFSQENMPYFRKRMTLEIVNGQLS